MLSSVRFIGFTVTPSTAPGIPQTFQRHPTPSSVLFRTTGETLAASASAASHFPAGRFGGADNKHYKERALSPSN
jgi:hypothetical protein